MAWSYLYLFDGACIVCLYMWRILISNSAAYAGSRIILRQVSPESEGIYDLILALHKSCGGDWKQLQADTGVSGEDVDGFLSYAAQFLGNLGKNQRPCCRKFWLIGH